MSEAVTSPKVASPLGSDTLKAGTMEQTNIVSHPDSVNKPLEVWVDPEWTPEMVEREDILDFGNTACVLHGLLTPAECEHIIAEAESAGFESLGGYRQDYRNNLRIVSMSEERAAVIFERIRPYIEDEIVIEENNTHRVSHSSYGLEGKWAPIGCNESFRVCKYDSGGHFAPHYDGAFIRTSSNRSFKTLNIYLNDGFDGGTTNFLGDAQDMFKDPDTGLFRGEEENVIFRVQPRPGSVLMFNHYRLHEGQQISNGEKYIMRTDVMYELVEGEPMSEKDEEALRLFQEAEHKETDGDNAGAVALYRRAFKMSPRLEAAYG